MLFKYYIISWYEKNVLPRVRENTAFFAMNIIQYHIIESELGNKELTEIKAKDIEDFLNQKMINGNRITKKGLSHSVLTKLRQYILACLRHANKEGIITKNFDNDISQIKIKYKRTKAFSIQERDYFLKETEKTKFGLIFYMLFYTGCRRGEILGLSWDNVDFTEKNITISQSILFYNNKVKLINNTKNETSYRIIPLPDIVIQKLKEHFNKQKNYLKQKGLNNHFGLVFIDNKGNPINPINLSRSFKYYVKHLGLSNSYHIHCTRHTWATLMLQNKVSLIDIQYLGGWSKPTVLLNIYSHITKDTHRLAMNKLFKK